VIEPKTVEMLALAVRRSSFSARISLTSHPQPPESHQNQLESHPHQLDLIHINQTLSKSATVDIINSVRSHPLSKILTNKIDLLHSAKYHPLS
jgi:hypothetical protein